MNKIFLTLFIILPNLAFAEKVPPVAQEARAQELIDSNNELVDQISLGGVSSVLIKRIVITGVILRDKSPLERIVKSNQNKRLSQEQIHQIIDDIRVLYLGAGYAGLVDVTPSIKKHVLTIHIEMMN